MRLGREWVPNRTGGKKTEKIKLMHRKKEGKG